MLRLLLAWRRLLRASALLLVCCFGTPAFAGEPLEPRLILLLRTPGDEDTMVRLRADLTDGGWRVLEIRPDPRSEREPLETIAERERASAGVRVDAASQSVKLWVQRDEGAIVEDFAARGEPSSGHVLALRVAESLRARGLLLPAAEPAPLETPPPTVVPKARETAPSSGTPPSRDGATFALELGPGLAVSPGSLEAYAALDTGIRLSWGKVWSVSALALFPLSRQSIAAGEGEARISTTVVGGTLEAEWSDWSFGGIRSGLGAGASFSSMSGRATSGYQGTDDTVNAFAALLRNSFHVNLGKQLRLRTAVLLGLTFPEVRVAFGDREVASWGRPFGVGSIALEASAP